MTTSMPRSVGADSGVAEIEVVISDRVEDIDDALGIVHDGFVEAGYLEPTPSGRRMHASYLNPGTTFFLARIDGEPVGACALIADGPFGLPSDRAFVEETDALRARTDQTIHEVGSLVVRREYRRSTRRIVMRLFAAIMLTAQEEIPASPISMSVSPENERFYVTLSGGRRLADPRPLYGAPAVLLLSPAGTTAADTCATRETPSQRRIDALLSEPNPAWLTDRRSRRPPPPAWLESLLEEQGVTDTLTAQLELLSQIYPQVLERVLRRAGSSVVA